ncbi:phytoene desaturase [Peniophora sp. CONT]|nr:phytoene desaturase [Peniophora sp. CONT]
MPSGSKPTAIVIGAGVGGVALATRLAKAGYKVDVYEKNDFIGGRCSLIFDGEYRFDQGPSLLLLPDLFRETFVELGTTLEDAGVKLLKCDPNYLVHFHDGETFKLSTDLAVMKGEVEKVEGKDGFERYLSWLQEAHRHYELSVEHVLKKNFYSFFSLMRPTFLWNVFALHPHVSIWTCASKFFKTERLRRVFTFGSMYMGVSPFDAPGTYSLLQYTELAEGIWYPIGGFNAVVQALVNLAKTHTLDVTYHLSAPVKSVNVSSVAGKPRATGILLDSGEDVHADIIVCNADLVYSYKELLPKNVEAERLDKKPGSCSSISFYWSMSEKIPQLGTHNVFLAEHYESSFTSIFADQELPIEPSFYVNVPSRVDSSAAPEGKDAIVVLVPVGHLGGPLGLKEGRMSEVVDIARRKVLATIEGRVGMERGEFQKKIAHEIVNTPETWRDKFNLDKGAILGLSHSFFNVLSFRPRTKHPEIEGCYFVGASTHPGTGVPICLAGAKITASQIVADARNESLYPTADYKPGRSAVGLDAVTSSSFTVQFATAVLAAIFAYALWMLASAGVLLSQ